MESKESKTIYSPMLFWRRVRKLKVIFKSLRGGVSISQACKAAGVDVSSLWKWRKLNEKLDRALYAIIDSRVMLMEDAHFRTGLEGNVTAQMNFLYNRAPDRWKDRRAQMVAEMNNYNVNNPLAKAKDSELEDIVRNRYPGSPAEIDSKE